MVVDDHALVRAAVRQAMDAPDIEVVAEAATAEEALALAPEARPDVMLVDIDLPGMDGVELCKRVRTVAELRETPIVLFVRDADPERLAELRAAGADFFLSKDLLVNYADWQQRLQGILDQVRQPMPS